jgi:hypothetical protein
VRHLALAACNVLLACASPPPPPPAAPLAPMAVEHDAALVETEPVVEAPERSRPPSTASYEEAMSTPEVLDLHDESPHLTDVQLAGPIRGALAGCRVPYNRKITIKTAVQYGRAIGVTVEVRVVRPKSAPPPKRAAAQAEAKTTATIAACVDQNVRALVWPPSRRRDSSKTDF